MRPWREIISASSRPFSDCWCLSPGTSSGPSLLFASSCMMVLLPAISEFMTSSIRARKKGNLAVIGQLSWGPYPVIILICFSATLISTTKSSKSSLYSCIRQGFSDLFAPIAEPPFSLFLMASKISKFSILKRPLCAKCVS